jgi:PAS domain S-box-containing protein
MPRSGDYRYIEALLEFLRGRQAVASACQADIRQHEIWALVSDEVDQLLAGSCSAHDLMAQNRDLAAEILGYEPVILSDCDAQSLHRVLPTCVGLRCVIALGKINASQTKSSHNGPWGRSARFLHNGAAFPHRLMGQPLERRWHRESMAIPEPSAASWLAAIVESSDDAIVSKTLDGTITSWNPAAERLFGYTAEEVIGHPISILAPPDRENEMPANLERIRRGERVERYETVRRRKDGSLVDVSLTVSPIRDDTGRIIGASKIARDITSRKQAEERQRLLTAELAHRVKNLFAVVQVLAERSAARSTSAAECIEAFRGRLQALSAAHKALIAGHWNWASLRSLLQTILAPYLGGGDRIRLDIQELQLNPDFALTLALGLNELATNAAKYGALASRTGRITLTARVEAAERGDEFRLLWQEHGGPAVEPPVVAGFGTSMLSQAIEYQHEGKVELDWRKEGLICRLSLPLAGAASFPASRQ